MVITPLRKLFTRQDKKVLLGLLLLSIIVSVFETVGISALMLFVSVATNFDLIFKSKMASKFYTWAGFSHPAYFVITLGVFLILFYIFRALLNITHVFSLNRFVQMRQHRFSVELFKRFMLLDYKDFVLMSSATMGQIIFSFTTNATQVLNGCLSIMAESFTIAAIYTMLFYVNWKMTLVLSLLLAVKVLGIAKIFSGRIMRAGKRAQEINVQTNKIFSLAFNNYKFLRLLGADGKLLNSFKKFNREFALANNVNAVWQILPRFILETIGFLVLIGVIIYVLFMHRTATTVIPIVSMYALAFYRFLPSVNKILTSYNQIIFNKHALGPLIHYLNIPFEQAGNKSIEFSKNVSLQNVSFSYASGKPIIRNSSLIINRGEKVGFIGASGAGKTTLIDIVIGLFSPEGGEILVDGVALSPENIRSWRQLIGYIPQQVYLFDGTAAENVVCDRVFDENLLVQVLKQANMYDFLQEKGGVHVQVGEAGIQLSGGQRQRLAIARALYGNPSILVLDEATSSLDNSNEEFIMNEIYNACEGRTMLIIAHRLSTIARCDRVFEVSNGIAQEISLNYALGGIDNAVIPKMHGVAG